MPVDSLERVTNLLALLLETKVPLTLQEIAASLGQYPESPSAQRAAFERDKAVLRDVGVPIATEVLGGDRAGATGYRVDRRRFELGDLSLSDDERRALQLAVAAVRTDVQWAREGVWKLAGWGDDGRSHEESVAVAAHVPSAPALGALHAASAQRLAVRFGYRDRLRTVDPYALMLRDGFWYLIGRDHDHDEVRSYRVDRIDPEPAVEAVDGAPYTVPEGFDPRAALPEDPKLIGEGHAPRREAVVRVWPPRAAATVWEVGEQSVVARRADGSVDVAVPFVNAAALRTWVLGFEEHAELLEPADVRAEIVAWLRTAERGTR